MKNGRNHWAWIAGLVLGFGLAFAVAREADAAVYDQIREKLQMRYPEAEIEVARTVRWVRGAFSAQDLEQDLPVVLLGESPQGEVQFEVQSRDRVLRAEGMLKFSAWIEARKAVRRVQVGEALGDESFKIEKIDLAQGAARELKHSLAAATQTVQGLEAKQTIPEGAWLLTHAADRIPDIRKGDRIPLRLISGELILSSPGVALESGNKNGRIRVLSGKSRREFQGNVGDDGSVEVRL